MATVTRKLSQSNPDLSVSHLSLQRSLEDLSGGIYGSNKVLDNASERSFGDQSFYSKGLSTLRRRLSVSNQRSKLVYMDRIAGLELQLSALVNAVTERAAELNNKALRHLAIGVPTAGNKESLPRSEEVSNCWSWIVQLSRLSQIHITYAAEYHKFFFEAHDIESSLEQEKARVFADLSMGDRRSLGSLPFECRRLSSCMRSHLSRLMLLGQRAHELAARSGSVQPVHLRVPVPYGEGSKRKAAPSEPRRAVALCSFTSTDGRHVVMDEEVTVIDQLDRNVWRVEKAGDGGQIDLPSVCLALLGPDTEALETMGRLRDTIVAVWLQILTSYKQQIGDLFRSFLEFVQMERYTVDSESGEASLFAFMSELESNYLCYLHDLEAAAFAKLLSQIRAKRAPPPEPAVRASRERRLSNVSLSSVTSQDGGGGGGFSRSGSQRSSGRRTRSLKESEVIQPRALLKVLNEHVEALERFRNRRLDAQEPLSNQDEYLRSPRVPVIRVQNDDELSTSANNVYVFSNQADPEKPSSWQSLSSQPPEGQQQPQHRSRMRNLSTASSRTVTSTVVNEDFRRPLTIGITSTDGPSLVRSSSEIGEPSPSVVEPQRHISRMYWMVNQPTKVEREIHRSELKVSRQLDVDLPYRNFVSAKRYQLGENDSAGILAVTKLECNYPPRRTVVDAGAFLDVLRENRMAQTLGDFKEIRPTIALATQTRPPEVSASSAFIDFDSVNVGIRVAEKPPLKLEMSVQTIGEFKEVKSMTAFATQTRQLEATDCGASLDFPSILSTVQASGPARSVASIQTSGSFKAVQPNNTLATQTTPTVISECIAYLSIPTMNNGARAIIPYSSSSASYRSGAIGASSAFMERQTGDSGAKAAAAQMKTSSAASKSAAPSECSAYVEQSTRDGGVRALAQTAMSSAACKPNVSVTSMWITERIIPKLDCPVQTFPMVFAECNASRTIQTAEATAKSEGHRGVESVAIFRPRLAVESGAQLIVEAKMSSVQRSGPLPAVVAVKCTPPAGVSTAVRYRTPAKEAASQANFQLELVGRLVVRNHNLECAQLLSLTRSVSEQTELVSSGQAKLIREAGLQCVEWSELGSEHKGEKG